MKMNSDNVRCSSIQDIIQQLKANGIKIIIYEPSIDSDSFFGIQIENELSTFKDLSTLIVANRFEEKLSDVSGKVYTRDIYRRD